MVTIQFDDDNVQWTHKVSTGESEMKALRTLTDAQKRLTWADGPDVDNGVGQKASDPFWEDSQDVPEFVKQSIRDALRAGAINRISDDLPAGVTRGDVQSFFEDKLTQPQGWSLRSLAEDYADRFGVDVDEAFRNVRIQSKSVLDEAREQGYEQQGVDGERRFKWVGPIDDDKTDASWDVLEQTNPDHGGTPRPLPELKSIVQEARNEHFPDLDAEWADSWQDRDTFVEHFE